MARCTSPPSRRSSTGQALPARDSARGCCTTPPARPQDRRPAVQKTPPPPALLGLPPGWPDLIDAGVEEAQHLVELVHGDLVEKPGSASPVVDRLDLLDHDETGHRALFG